MAEYDAQIASALRLITKKGRAITLRRDGGTVLVDAARPELGFTASTTDHATVGVFLLFNTKEINGTTVLEGDQTVLVPASGLTITPGVSDKLYDGATVETTTPVWKIAKVQTQKPGSQEIMHELQIRQ